MGMLVAGVRSSAEETASASSLPVVLVVARPLGGQKDWPFLRILADAMDIELDRAGMNALVPDALPTLAEASRERMLEEARSAGADFLLVESYNSGGQNLRLEVEVLRAEDGKKIASAEVSRKIDLRLDESAGEAAARLLPQLRPYLAEVTLRKREAAAKTPEEPAPTAEEPALTAREPQGGQEPALAGQPPPPEAQEEVPEEAAPAEAGPSLSSAPPPEPLPAPEGLRPPGAPQPPAPPPVKRFEVGAGGAAFLPIAGISSLFQAGYLASAYLEYRWSLAAATLALGLHAGYTGLVPEQAGTASYFHSLVPLDLSLRVGTRENSRLAWYLRVQGGAALNLSPQAKVDQRLTRVLPQAGAGGGLSFAFSPCMGASLEFLYEFLLYLYLKDGKLAAEPIMGFAAPSILVYRRW
jgi:hypothetical protein